jgi:hypothetical protein
MNMLPQLRDLLRAEPFRPFAIPMVDGASFVVDHRDSLLVSTQGRVLIYEGFTRPTGYLNPNLSPAPSGTTRTNPPDAQVAHAVVAAALKHARLASRGETVILGPHD